MEIQHLPNLCVYVLVCFLHSFQKSTASFFINLYTGCFKTGEFRIQSVVGKDPVELEKYLGKKIALPEEDISTLILFNT
jgi:hypothetical protein